jgi:hypothetical protein
MAENHKAAPSELQILEELCRQRDVVAAIMPQGDQKNVVKQTCKNIVKSFVSLNGGENQFVLNFISQRQSSQQNILDAAYELHQGQDDSDYTLFTLQRIQDSNNDDFNNKKVTKVHKYLIKAFQRAGVTPTDQSIVSIRCQEEEASTLIMLQHLDYQRRLLSLLLATTIK